MLLMSAHADVLGTGRASGLSRCSQSRSKSRSCAFESPRFLGHPVSVFVEEESWLAAFRCPGIEMERCCGLKMCRVLPFWFRDSVDSRYSARSFADTPRIWEHLGQQEPLRC